MPAWWKVALLGPIIGAESIRPPTYLARLLPVPVLVLTRCHSYHGSNMVVAVNYTIACGMKWASM